MKRILLILILFICLPSLGSAKVLTDAAGRPVDLPAEPERVVSLAPSITELVYSLGQEAKLKGATQYSNYPPAARRLPRVGSYVHLDLERIVSLRPDLCLAIRDGNPKHTIEQIEAMGIPVFAIDPRNLTEIMESVTMLGEVLGARVRAAALVENMQERIARVQERVGRAEHQPRVFFQVDAHPVVSVGTKTFIHELVTLAGGRNVTAGSVTYPRCNWEDILRLQPEVAIITSMAGGHSPQELRAAWQQWPQLEAVRRGRVHVVDANLFDRPTDRLVRGLETLARLIHPELYGDEGDF